jgi:superfamily II DNA/RNA helicase
MKTKRETKRITKSLQDENYKADFMNGDLPQRKRERVLNNFTKGRVKILVATDIASRGIDISNIRLVVNYDIPEIPEDYVHRIGRTARAGKSGKAISFITGGDNTKWKRIQKLIKKNNSVNKRIKK